MLQIKDVTVYYHHIRALHDVSLEVEEKEIVCLLGANGAGKSTLLNLISGVVSPRDGDVLFSGSSIVGMPPTKIVGKNIIQIPEGRLVFQNLTVLECLEMGAYSRPRREFRERLSAVFDLFPRLAERRDQLGGLMSGGEQQMLAIGRGLMANPTLLLLDEPSMGLAPMIVKDIFKVLARLRDELGLTVLLVEQNASAALGIADRAYVLTNGEISKSGTASQLLADPTMKEVYLGAS